MKCEFIRSTNSRRKVKGVAASDTHDRAIKPSRVSASGWIRAAKPKSVVNFGVDFILGYELVKRLWVGDSGQRRVTKVGFARECPAKKRELIQTGAH